MMQDKKGRDISVLCDVFLVLYGIFRDSKLV